MPVVRGLRVLAQRAGPHATAPGSLNAIRAISTTSSVSARTRPNAKKPEPSPLTKPYTPEQIQELKELYTPEQAAALLQGEAVIDRSDFEKRIPRNGWDQFAMPYLDDLSEINPILDFPPEEMIEKEGMVFQDIPKMHDPAIEFSEEEVEGEVRWNELSRATGYPVRDLKKLIVRPLVLHRVVNQTRLGKIQKMYSLVVAGNGDGLLGIGEGKSVEILDAQQMATYNAIRNMVPIPRYEHRTTFGRIAVKNGAVEMEVMSRPPGFGVRCSHYIYEMCRCAGIHDLSARVTRSRNPMNVIKTFMYALQRQKLPDVIARGRGQKLVDVRKVYYG